MIERSFVLLPGIGRGMEESLWRQGICDWGEFLRARKIVGMSERRWTSLREHVEKLVEMKEGNRLREIAALLPRTERWRVLHAWDDRYAALDIETVERGRGSVPVAVSICRGSRPCRTFIRHDDLCWSGVAAFLKDVDFLVTFNGSSFDLPVLKENGYEVRRPLHIDIRGFTRRAGLHGGLKRIESQLGMKRPKELEYSTAGQTSYLWRLWSEKGSKNALDLLIEYNQRDARSLVALSTYVYKALSEKTFKEAFPSMPLGVRAC